MLKNKSYCAPAPRSPSNITQSKLIVETTAQQKLALIFNKADRIIKELNQYREKKSESFYYEEEVQGKQLNAIRVLDLSIKPVKQTRGESVGSQTQQQVDSRVKTKTHQDEGRASTQCLTNYSQGPAQNYSRTFSRFHERYSPIPLVREVHLTSSTNPETKKRSLSKGISVVSQSPYKNTSKSKPKKKINLIRTPQRYNK